MIHFLADGYVDEVMLARKYLLDLAGSEADGDGRDDPAVIARFVVMAKRC